MYENKCERVRRGVTICENEWVSVRMAVSVKMSMCENKCVTM